MTGRSFILAVMIGMTVLTACGKWEVETSQMSAEMLKEAEEISETEKISGIKETDDAEKVSEIKKTGDAEKISGIKETSDAEKISGTKETGDTEKISETEEIMQKALAETAAFWEEPEWESLYAKAIEKYEEEHEREVRYELVYAEGESIPKLYFHCLDDSNIITEIYGLKEGMQLVPEENWISKKEEKSYLEIDTSMEFDEILQYLEIRSIAKKEKRQIWEVKGLEFLWRVLNRKEYLPSSISADLYSGGNGTHFLVKDFSGDGIPEIVVSSYLFGDYMAGSGVYCFDGSDYVGGTDYTLETYDEDTGTCGMLYGVSYTEDYMVGSFKGNEFIAQLEFGTDYESNRYWKIENGTEEEIDVQEFRELRDYYISYGNHGISGEVLNIQNVEKAYGIQLSHRQYDRVLKAYYDAIHGKRELNIGTEFEEYNLDYYFKSILDNEHEFTLLDCDKDSIPELYIGTCVTPDRTAEDYLDEKKSREAELNRLTILSYECGIVFLTEWEFHDWHEIEYVLRDGQLVNYIPWWMTEISMDTTVTSHFRYDEEQHRFSAQKGDAGITYFVDGQEVEKEDFVKIYQSTICDMRIPKEDIYVYNEENLKKALLVTE